MSPDRLGIRAPDTLSDREFCDFFRKWIWQKPSGEGVVLDFATADFVAPWAAAMFGAYARWLQVAEGCEVEAWINDQSKAGRFLRQIGLPELLAGTRAPDRPEDSNRLVSLRQVHQSQDIQPCVTSIMRLLEVDDQEMADAVKYALVELLRNVVQHAHSPVGAVVTALYYWTAGIVSLTVVDAGCGIAASLQQRYPEIQDDYKAVKFAIQPHVSGTFQRGEYSAMADNAGLGLFFIRQIATLSGGGFFLGSGRMLADLWGNKDGSPGKKYLVAAQGAGWPGTVAMLQLRRRGIGEFNSVLQTCRDLAAAARKDPTELKLDFIESVPDVEGLLVVLVRRFEEDVETAAAIRDSTIVPALANGQLVVLDFQGIRAATQSFAHALMYKLLRDGQNVEVGLSIAGADSATQEAIRTVAAYARMKPGG